MGADIAGSSGEQNNRCTSHRARFRSVKGRQVGGIFGDHCSNDLSGTRQSTVWFVVGRSRRIDEVCDDYSKLLYAWMLKDEIWLDFLSRLSARWILG